MDLVTQIEGAAGQHPFTAKVVLLIAFVVVLKGWNVVGPLVSPLLGRLLTWLGSLKPVPAPGPTPPLPAQPGEAIPTPLAAIQSLFVAAMAADAPDSAFENVVAIAKAYKAKATSGASSL